jgi:excisionase family DNA binding protein
MSSLIGVREAAHVLGVHENTLRRWEKAGLVRAVKLPTGVRRFRPEDIDRLRKEMYDDAVGDEAAPAAGEAVSGRQTS